MDKKGKKQAYFGYALLAMVAAVLTWRCFYGFCWSDESFYLTFAQRMWNGQQLIVDEWHPVQFYSAVLYPVYSLYHMIFGTTGIYLFARIFYTFLAFGCSLLVFYTFSREHALLPAWLCAVSVLLYSRGNIWGASYYNLFLLLTVAAFCLALLGRQRTWLLLPCGLCLGFSVLCVPYFAPFVIAALAAGTVSGKHRKMTGWIFAGICLAAGYFLVCFLPRDLGAVLSSLGKILSDPEHETGPVSNLILAIRDVKLLYYYEACLVLLSTGLVLIGGKLPKKWGQIPGLLIALGGALVSFLRYRNAETGFAAYTFVLFCLPLLASRWLYRKMDRMALALRILGVAMGLSMALSSNTEAIGFTVGLAVYAMGVMLQLIRPEEQPLRRLTAVVLAAIMLLATFSGRVTQVFRDGALSDLKVTMTQGPAAGIRTTREHAQQYGEILSMLDDLQTRCREESSIFFTKLLPWGYLACDYPCAAPTAWRTALDSPRLEAYYQEHSLPEIVVILSPEVGNYPYEPTPNENTLSGWLWENMYQAEYSCLEYPCATVYLAPGAAQQK